MQRPGDVSSGTLEVIFLHGFLGSPEDWREVIDFLPSYSCQALDLAKELPTALPQDSIVVAYSMGGRIALTLPPTRGLVILSSHFGLKNDEERAVRRKKEDRELLQMRTDFFAFLNDWYKQPLFSTLKLDDALLQRRRSIDYIRHAELFDKFRLSEQPLFTPPPHALLLYGERDQKYAALYSNYPNARAIPEAGHAAHIENPRSTADMITLYIEELYAQLGNTHRSAMELSR